METKENKAPQSLKEYLKHAGESIGVFKWLFSLLFASKESKKWLKKMMIALGAVIALQAIQPAALSFVFNGLKEKSGNPVAWGLGFFFASIIAQKIIERSYYGAKEWLMGIMLSQLDNTITEKFFEKSLAQHAQDSHLLSTTTIEKGKSKAYEMMKTLLFEGSTTLIQLSLSLICLFFLNLMAGTIMLTVICLYVLFSLYLNSIVSRVLTPLDIAFRKLSRRRSERCEGIERVKVSAKEIKEVEEMSQEFGLIIDEDRKFWMRFFDLACLRALINASGLIAIMSWGAYLVWKGNLSIGLLYPLYAWSTRVSENIWRLGEIEHGVNWNLPAVMSMMKGVLIPAALQDADNAVSIRQDTPHLIEFVDVSHTYRGEVDSEKEAPPALSNISFNIAPGEKVALLGSSGAGKSTLMKKLLRFDDPTSGAILIGGIDLRNIRQSSWKQGIGYIPQQAQVFDGTIRSNLVYSLSPQDQKNISDEELWKLMRLLKIDFKDRLTEGLDTVVGKDGVKLSGGQAQRLMIGAAVIKKPWLLIVDEATSSLDSTTERQVQEGLSRVLSGNNTSALIVAHRLSTVRYLCSKFVVLKSASNTANGDSQVEAIAGSFEELYELSPIFRQLADDQGVAIKRELATA